MHVNEANRPDRHSKIDDEALIVDLRKILDHAQVVLKRKEQDSQRKGAEGHAETTSSAEEMGGEGTSSTSEKPGDKERELNSVVERALQGLTRQADTAVAELAGAEPGDTTEATAKEAEKDELATFKASEVELVINSLNDPMEWSGMAERDVMIDSVLYYNNPTGILFRFRCDLALATSNRDAAEVERLTKELDLLFALWAAPLAEIAEYPLERLCALARSGYSHGHIHWHEFHPRATHQREAVKQLLSEARAVGGGGSQGQDDFREKREVLSSGSVFDLDDVRRKLQSRLSLVDRLPKCNSLEEMIVLRDAWNEADRCWWNASRAKRHAKLSFGLLLLLSICVTLISVLSSQANVADAEAAAAPNRTSPPLAAVPDGLFGHIALGLSLLTSFSVSYIAFLNPVQRWQQLRSAALMLESEIWAFRCRVGAYRQQGSRGSEKVCEALRTAVDSTCANVLSSAGVASTNFYRPMARCATCLRPTPHHRLQLFPLIPVLALLLHWQLHVRSRAVLRHKGAHLAAAEEQEGHPIRPVRGMAPRGPVRHLPSTTSAERVRRSPARESAPFLCATPHHNRVTHLPHLVARSSRLTVRALSQRKQIRDASRPTTAPPSCRQSRSSSRRSRPRCSLWSASRRGSPSSPFAHRVLPRGPSSLAPRRSSHATRRPSRL